MSLNYGELVVRLSLEKRWMGFGGQEGRLKGGRQSWPVEPVGGACRSKLLKGGGKILKNREQIESG